MKPSSSDEILDLVDASFASAALGAAMELGLFWLLAERPLSVHAVARELGIAPIRCQYWLQLIHRIGLIEPGPRGFELTPTARTAILDVFSHGSWALLAEEARERLPGLGNLPGSLRGRRPIRKRRKSTVPAYITRMTEEPERARRFTRMLYELHQPLADALADSLDLEGVHRLMDLGGGSGVISLALLDRHPGLTATVVDLATVCAAGREIAAECGMENRITYRPADFLRDALPSGFDVVLECDVDVYGETLFRRVLASLNPGGRFVIVDQFAPAEGVAPGARLHWALARSLDDSEFTFPTAAGLRKQLERAGFRAVSERRLAASTEPCARFCEGMDVLEASK